jgi:hypothetical protein
MYVRLFIYAFIHRRCQKLKYYTASQWRMRNWLNTAPSPFSFTEKALRLHYQSQPGNVVSGKNGSYYEYHTKPINSLRRKCEAFKVKSSVPWKFLSFIIFLMWWDWVRLVLRPYFGLLYQRQMINDDCGAIGGMLIGRGNQSTLRKPAPVPLCPP